MYIPKDMEWLKDLKAGDRVAIRLYRRFGGGDEQYVLSTVEKVTPSGRVRFENGSTYRLDGREVGGDTYNRPLRQVTAEILDAIKRNDLLNKINPEKFLRKLSAEQLETLLEWQSAILGAEAPKEKA